MSGTTTSRGASTGRGSDVPGGPDDGPGDGAIGAWADPSARLRTLLTVVLALVLVAALVVIATSWQSWRAAESEAAARSDAVRVAEQFTARVNDYSPADVGTYQKSVESLLTTKFATEFSSAMKDVVTEITRADMTSRGEVLTSGVSTIDPDSATVLVVSDAQVKSSYGTRVRHFRWRVSLVSVDGQWRVDDFEPVGA